jgi:hypothetical protein
VGGKKIPGGPYENLEVRRFKKAKNSEWNDLNINFLVKNRLEALACSYPFFYG